MSEPYVRVMRSHDYCHFEICLSVHPDATFDEVNQRRKEAALLVDEAVRQYKLAKEAENRRAISEREIARLLDRIEHIKQLPESEWSPEEAALVRVSADEEYWSRWHDDDYCYLADEERDYHFSMLDRFKAVTVRAV